MKLINTAILSIVAIALTACGGTIDVKKIVETDLQKALQSQGMKCGVEKDTVSVEISCEDSVSIISVKATAINKVKPVDTTAVKDSAVVAPVADTTVVDTTVAAPTEQPAVDSAAVAPVADTAAVVKTDTTAATAEAPVAPAEVKVEEPAKAVVDSAAVSTAIEKADTLKQEPVKIDTATAAAEAPKA